LITKYFSFLSLRTFIILGGLILSFLLAGASSASAATYYVATNGSDTNSGTLAAPFRNIQKCASVATAGDTCSIRAGTYRETVKPANSGSASSPVVFTNYNNEVVTVSGANPVTASWSVHSGSIYKASLPTAPVQVFVDGQMMTLARWPNVGSDYMKPTQAVTDTGSNSTTIIDAALPALNWTGANVWMSANAGWSVQTGSVSSYSAGRLTVPNLTDCQSLCPIENSRYYVFGKLELLDTGGEWYASGGTLYLRTPNSDSPAGHTVEVKAREQAFDLTARQYVTIKGLKIFASGISMNSSSGNNVIDGITAKYVNHFDTPGGTPTTYYSRGYGWSTGIVLAGSNNVLTNSDIGWSASSLVSIMDDNNRVENNYLHEGDYSGLYYAPILVMSNGNKILRNTIQSSGRDGINFQGAWVSKTHRNTEVGFNDISKFSTLVPDSGGTYAFNVDMTGSVFHHNVVHDATPHPIASPGRGPHLTMGIYFDGSAGPATLHHNVFWKVGSTAIVVNNGSVSHPFKVYNNTVAAEATQKNSVSSQSSASNTEVSNNILLKPYVTFQGGCCGGYYTNFLQINNLGPTNPPDPKFVNAASANYRLQSDSPAINAGKPIPGITDGPVGTPDIGAYEFGGTDWTAGASGGGPSRLPSPGASAAAPFPLHPLPTPCHLP
jgi:hypothetical protein